MPATKAPARRILARLYWGRDRPMAPLGLPVASKHARALASLAWLFVALAADGTRPAYAVCDVIPGPTAEYRGALGTLNRPFAIPGDVGQQLEITLKPAQCDDISRTQGFQNLGGGLAEDDY